MPGHNVYCSVTSNHCFHPRYDEPKSHPTIPFLSQTPMCMKSHHQFWSKFHYTTHKHAYIHKQDNLHVHQHRARIRQARTCEWRTAEPGQPQSSLHLTGCPWVGSACREPHSCSSPHPGRAPQGSLDPGNPEHSGFWLETVGRQIIHFLVRIQVSAIMCLEKQHLTPILSVQFQSTSTDASVLP